MVRRESRLSPTTLLRELPHLWSVVQAERHEQTDELLKPYGKLYRRRVTWSLSDSALRDWLNEQRSLERSRSHAILIAVGLTITGWLIGLGAILKWDRVTGGYRRPMIVGVIVLLLLVITAGGWWTLLSETGSITTRFV